MISSSTLSESIKSLLDDALQNYYKEIETFLHEFMLDSMIVDLPNHYTFVKGDIPDWLKEKTIKEFVLYIEINGEKKILDQMWFVKKDFEYKFDKDI